MTDSKDAVIVLTPTSVMTFENVTFEVKLVLTFDKLCYLRIEG